MFSEMALRNSRRKGEGWGSLAGLYVLLALLCLSSVCLSSVASAQDLRGQKSGSGVSSDVLPDELINVDIEEKFGESIPLGLRFTNERGERVALKQYFDGKRPVILTLNYSDCPMLCAAQLNALVKGLKGLKWTPGEDFELVTVSIDPKETPKKATLAKRKYFRAYARPEAEKGWHFLTVDERLEGGVHPRTKKPYAPGESQIQELADALGFRYAFHPRSGEYLHTAALFVLSPEGKICRYLYGVNYPTDLLRTALIESGEGQVGTLIDRLILYCFLDYDSESGGYAAVAYKLMRFSALGFALIFGLFLAWLWFGGRGSRHQKGVQHPANTETVAL
ncbi:MAG: SCO family protein [Planctomycetota bacterium]|nr:MAG: SCO family protein [Planctomycetota bacterium]